jgi:hypothetical protein
MGWRILVNFICQPMLKLKTHSGVHDLFLKFIYRAMLSEDRWKESSEAVVILGSLKLEKDHIHVISQNLQKT